ncbi:hypothetical protein SDC9_155781 [bioreactor metagenome]|uniref:Uncharacterized protein n=1 Tax=bioreactor metagenome TaxID=1076179 RepID=A0A645F4Z5_9ZZZZ
MLAEQLYGSSAPYPCGCIFMAHKLGLFEVENKLKKAACEMVKIAGKLDNSLKKRGERAIAPRIYDQKIIDSLEKLHLLRRLKEITKNDSSTD